MTLKLPTTWWERCRTWLDCRTTIEKGHILHRLPLALSVHQDSMPSAKVNRAVISVADAALDMHAGISQHVTPPPIDRSRIRGHNACILLFGHAARMPIAYSNCFATCAIREFSSVRLYIPSWSFCRACAGVRGLSSLWGMFSLLLSSSPPARQSPNARRNQFDRISRWITEIQGFATPRPFDFLLNGDPAYFQFFPPSIQCVSFDTESKMSWSLGSMSG